MQASSNVRIEEDALGNVEVPGDHEELGQLSREQLDIRRRRLQFRCWHRGTQEIDLVLGSFAETCLERLDGAELERFEALLDCPDVDLFDWIFVGVGPPPQHDHELMRQLRGFSAARHHRPRQSAQRRT